MKRVGVALAAVLAVSCGQLTEPRSSDHDPAPGDAYVETASGGVRLWAHGTPGDGGGDGAEIAGVLRLDNASGCLYLEEDGERFPVIWPHGTEIVEDDPLQIQLPDGTGVSLGTTIAGGGGYDKADQVMLEIPESCLSSSGEVARFNQQAMIEIRE